MKKTILIIVIICLASFAQAEDADKFCKDEQTWAYIDSLVANRPNDTSLQILHALRIGLCVKIEDKSITISEAINLYNNMVDTAANKRGEEEGETKEF